MKDVTEGLQRIRNFLHAQSLGVLGAIARERKAQDEKWGEQNHPDGTGRPMDGDVAARARDECDAHANNGTLEWRHILHEEVCEALAESDPEKLYVELIQVAAVAAAWAEAIKLRVA